MRAILQLICFLFVASASAQIDILHAPDVALLNVKPASGAWKQNLLAYYSLSGTTNDSHTGGYNLYTNGGATVYVAGKNSTAYDVSVGNVYMRGTTAFPGLNSTSYTVSAWFVATNIAVNQTIACWQQFGGVMLRINSSKAEVSHYDGSWKAKAQTNTISSGTWYHYLVRYSRPTTNLSLWINGAFMGSVAANAANASSGPTVHIGAEVGGNYANGLVDEVAFWNRALSDAEIVELYNGGAGKFYESF